VNRLLDGSIYPNKKLVPFSLNFFLLGVEKHNNLYLRLVTPSVGGDRTLLKWDEIFLSLQSNHSFSQILFLIKRHKEKNKINSYFQKILKVYLIKFLGELKIIICLASKQSFKFEIVCFLSLQSYYSFS